MIDLNSKSALSDRLNYLIDASTPVDGQDRSYLGASIVGHQCERAVQYHYMAAKGDVTRALPAPRILRIFDRGNLYEDRARIWLKQAGFLFGTPPAGLAFSDCNGEFQGHVDGVITGWKVADTPCPVELPALWECKCLGSKGWKKLADVKLAEYSSTYWAQVHIYMYYLQLERCLFTAVNADTMEIYHELIPFDTTEATLYRCRAQAAITATHEGYMLQRLSKDPAYYICKMCDFRGVCHDRGN